MKISTEKIKLSLNLFENVPAGTIFISQKYPDDFFIKIYGTLEAVNLKTGKAIMFHKGCKIFSISGAICLYSEEE